MKAGNNDGGVTRRTHLGPPAIHFLLHSTAPSYHCWKTSAKELQATKCQRKPSTVQDLPASVVGFFAIRPERLVPRVSKSCLPLLGVACKESEPRLRMTSAFRVPKCLTTTPRTPRRVAYMADLSPCSRADLQKDQRTGRGAPPRLVNQGLPFVGTFASDVLQALRGGGSLKHVRLERSWLTEAGSAAWQTRAAMAAATA